MSNIELIGLPNIPLVQPGDNIATFITTAIQQIGLTLTSHDIVVIAQKIVSKSEGCFVRLSEVTASARALELAKITGKPPAYVEVVLWDTASVIRARQNLLLVEHKLGFISANAGIDQSNVAPPLSPPLEGTKGGDIVLRLPPDPDASARAIRQKLAELTGAHPPVLIIDSHGRPWRWGTVGVTIGLSGLAPVQDLRGTPDLFGRRLQHTDVGLADQIAAAASLVMGQAAEGCPVVIMRGLPFIFNEQAKAADVLRPKEIDEFR